MLRSFFYFFLVLHAAVLFISCGAAQRVVNGEHTEIIPTGSDAIILEAASTTVSVANDETTVKEEKSIRSFVPQDYIILEYVKEDLNADDVEEDIVLYTTYSVDAVYVFIASFDNNANKYRFIWQAPTKVVSEKPLSLSIRDITGDMRKEIVVRGSVKKDDIYLQSIEIFHMLDYAQYDIAKYRKVFENVTNSDIDIAETVEEQETTGASGKKSLSIILYNVNEQTKDIIKSFYRWDAIRNTYISYKSTVFNRTEIIKKKIDSLYYGSTGQWQEYLRGMWRSSANDDYPTLLYFSHELPNISIYSQEKLQAMEWLRTVRTIDTSGLGAQVYVRNMVLPQIKKWIRIRIIDDKTLDVYFGDDVIGANRSGRYIAVREVAEIVKQIELFTPTGKGGLEQIKYYEFIKQLLFGSFEEERTQVLYVFQYPRLEVISAQAQTREEFYFAIFNIGYQQVLQLKNIKSLHEKSKFYILERNGEKIQLKPVHLFFHTVYKNTAEDTLQLISKTQ